MLKKINFADFKAVPWLASSQLAQTHNSALKFSTKRPNVIVGPNGAGKSALLTSLAIRFLAYFTGQSAFDCKYTKCHESECWWTNAHRYGNEWTFLSGLKMDTDNAPALYYRPNHIPGNEEGATMAMMTGYFEEAKAYAQATERMSSGQANQAMLERVVTALEGRGLPDAYEFKNWSFGAEPRDLFEQQHRRGYTGPWEYKAEVLKKLLVPASGAIPLILMDEPEQSLDARAQAKLWRTIAAADCSKMQVVIATHSIFPLLHPKCFNIIEAEAGFVQQVLDLNASIN